MDRKFDHTKAIFVFGSNEGGFHGAGAARFALEHRGAQLRNPFGLQGRSYAIPTKDREIRNTLDLPKIKDYVNQFLLFAEQTKGTYQYQVTCIGCGLAGLKHGDVALMFYGAPDNCWFDEAWKPYLDDSVQYWGTF